LSGKKSNQTNYKILCKTLSNECCDHVISLLPPITDTKVQTKPYNQIENFNTDQWFTNEITKFRINLLPNHPAYKYIVSHTQDVLQDFKIDYMYVTYYEPGNLCKVHSDPVDTTAIILLNNQFTGGEFYIEPNKIDLDIGDMLIFDNKNNFHGVKSVNTGNRYALSIWLSKQ